ncbi:MAG: hypothetical protein J7518_20475 [Nocardioidaceae bacterium]|nr:hypothetical protein [Nocardioidaceae bacterium]
MAAPIKPGLHSVLKMTSFWLVPTLSNPPKKTEIEAVGGFYITCFLTEENTGWTVQFNKGSAPRLLCNNTVPEVLLPSTTQGVDIVGVVNPQAASSANDKKAFEFLRAGFSGFMARRQNVLNDTADTTTVGEFLDARPVDITPAVIDQSAQTAEGVYVFKAGVAVTGDGFDNIAVVAGP